MKRDLAETQGQWQTNVSDADDPDRVIAAGDALLETTDVCPAAVDFLQGDASKAKRVLG